jgi:uncharacterized protein
MKVRSLYRLLGLFLVTLLVLVVAACGQAAPPPAAPTAAPAAPKTAAPTTAPAAPKTAAPTAAPAAAATPATKAPAAAATPATKAPAAAATPATKAPAASGPAVKVKPGANWPNAATVGSASIGGTYYIWAGGWAKIISDNLVPTSVEVTGGPVPNIQLVNENRATFGFATNGAIYEGWNGLEWAAGRKYDNVRTMFPMYASYYHFIAPVKHNINSLDDLNGKVIGGGPAGGTPDVYGTKRLLDSLGIQPSRVVNAGYSDANGQVRDGQIVGYTMFVGVPQASALELETTEPSVILAPTEEQMDKFIAENPFFSKGVIPGGIYRSLPNDLPTLSIWNSALTHKDQPDDLIYEVVKATFENHADLVATHSSAEETLAENINTAVVPLHPGALRYYQEKGIQIDPRLMP